MPSTVKTLLESVNLDISKIKTCRWGQNVDADKHGIYFISTSLKTDCIENTYKGAPISINILDKWISKIKTIEIDGRSGINSLDLFNRLNKFWLPDENILYIGQTECNGGLKKRLSQYYKTNLGERKPHAGGHWIKTLLNLTDLYVHYIPTFTPLILEKEILVNFTKEVSQNTLTMIGDPELPLPFANLEIDKSRRKKHGVYKSKVSANPR